MRKKCKIGIISKPRDPTKNYLLFLGETNEQDEKLLYNLHKELRFLCNFNAVIEESNAQPDNIEEILCFQKKYNIEPKIWFTGVVEEKIIRLLAPQLYDISCMVPLFSDQIQRSVKPSGNSQPGVFFIFTDCVDPFMRGKIIDNCFEATGDREISFYLLGSNYGINRLKTCDLSRRYLLSCGVEDKNIICCGEGQNQGWLIEAINMIKFVTGNGEQEIVIAVNRESINMFMNYIRSEKAFGRIDRKVRIISD